MGEIVYSGAVGGPRERKLSMTFLDAGDSRSQAQLKFSGVFAQEQRKS